MTMHEIKADHEYEYSPAGNEEGWKCYCGERPGEPPGFAPELDVAQTEVKVDGILHALHEVGLVLVSSNSEAEGIADRVVAKCRRRNVYDQYSIMTWIMAHMAKGHRKYWKRVSRGVLSGNDPRNRCPCGELSTSSSWEADSDECVYRCKDHYNTKEVPQC